MADFFMREILNKISEYDELTKDNANIDTLVEYNVLGKCATSNESERKEDIIETCSNIKNYLNKILKLA